MFKKAKIRTIRGLKCQGRKEEWYINSLKGDLPAKAKFIQTPIGRYTPDFEYDDKYIEIKGGGTWKVLLGQESYIRGGKISDLQWRKIQWVAANIKPVHIIIICNKDVTMKLVENNIPQLPPGIKVEIYLEERK